MQESIILTKVLEEISLEQVILAARYSRLKCYNSVCRALYKTVSVLCLVCLCARLVYMCLVVTCWERADLLALACGVLL